MVADALSTGRQDCRTITHEGIDAEVEVLLAMYVGDVVALDSSRALASAASIHRGRSALLETGDWPLQTASLDEGGKGIVAVGFVSATASSGPDPVHTSVQAWSHSLSLAPDPTHARPLPAGSLPLVPGPGP